MAHNLKNNNICCDHGIDLQTYKQN